LADREPVHKLLDSLPVQVRLLLGELDRRAQVRNDSPRPPVASLVPDRPPRPAAGAVVVTCRDDGPLLLDTLASVRSCRADAVETVVVDHGSTDEQSCAVLAAVEAAGVSVVRIGGPGLAAARNAGVAATVAPLVTFLGAGDLLRPGFVAAAAACLDRAGDVAAVGGVLTWFSPGSASPDHPGGGDVPWDAVGPGGAWRREAVIAARGFDEHLSAPGLEDLDLRLSLLSRGWHVVRLEAPAVLRRLEPFRESASDDTSSRLGRVIEKHQSQATASFPYAELLRAADAAVAAVRSDRHRAVIALEEVRRVGAQAKGAAQDRLDEVEARARGAQAALAAAARGGRILEERVDELTDEVVRREHAAEAARRRGADEHASRRAEAARADELAHQLAAIHATKLWRWSVRPRRVYALIRRLQGRPPP
ncbi:MAG: glycosyltransferase family A protein, partial [Acidimicrobiales bacterium]